MKFIQNVAEAVLLPVIAETRHHGQACKYHQGYQRSFGLRRASAFFIGEENFSNNPPREIDNMQVETKVRFLKYNVDKATLVTN